MSAQVVALHKTRARRINTMRCGDWMITKYGTIQEIVAFQTGDGIEYIFTRSGRYARDQFVPTMRIGVWRQVDTPENVMKQAHVRKFINNPRAFLDDVEPELIQGTDVSPDWLEHKLHLLEVERAVQAFEEVTKDRG